MRIKEIPNLENGHILKRSMLLALEDASILTNEFLRKGYSNGIISGCNLTTTQDTITLNPGLIFFDDRIFMIKKAWSVKYKPTNVTMVLKLCLSDEMRDADCIYRDAELNLTEQVKIQAGEIELCRFKLQDGAKLRYKYQNFEDMDTEYDTLNIIHASCSGIGEETLPAEVSRSFAREMMEQENIEDFDALFCLQILGQAQAVTKEALVKYLEYKTKEKVKSHDNIDIYKGLLFVLRQQMGKGSKTKEMKEKTKWRMMLE